MNVFGLRDRLIEDYGSFVRSFINIHDERINSEVCSALERGTLWPEPLVQLNPCFERGDSIDDLVASGVLHEECSRIFRLKMAPDDNGKTLPLYKHQSDAVRKAHKERNYILTTGTGSGKSLAYLIPIVDHVLRSGSGRGIQAVIVYPMNALANSQLLELEKFLCFGYPDCKGPVTFSRYTGQESEEEKNKIVGTPPDILLTNYVMLELILTRPQEKNLVNAAQDLRFIVLDELHTYRGRQGADVAMLVRRAREAFGATTLQCIGTSATLGGTGTWKEQQCEVAKVASQLFGAPFEPDDIIGETLRRVTEENDVDSADFAENLKKRLNSQALQPTDSSSITSDPLAIWLESRLGVRREQESGLLVRQTPSPIRGEQGIAGELSDVTGESLNLCIERIQQVLLAGYNCLDPDTNLPLFAFRLHQFISRGENIFASLETEGSRYITVSGLKVAPGRRDCPLLPLVFCRECGQEYYSVWRERLDDGGICYLPRDYTERMGEDNEEAGYLYTSTTNPWPSDEVEALRRLPEDWLDDQARVRHDRRKYVPEHLVVEQTCHEGIAGLDSWYIAAPFRFCLNCGVSFGFRQRSDFHKLTALGSEGRSTATTILSLSAIRHLRDTSLEDRAKKLLSFTDNRQDASLQAGHFNDFVEIGLLRAALYAAVRSAGGAGLGHDELPQKVFEELNLPFDSYAADPIVRGWARDQTNRVLREVIGYRLYRDLQRGWRITAPNLEQVGLLEIAYPSLTDVCEDTELWTNTHPTLRDASSETRFTVAKTLLDYIRRSLSIKADYLNPDYQEGLIQRSRQRLIPPWGFDESDQVRNLVQAAVVFPRSRRRGDFRGNVYLSARGGFGQYLRRLPTFESYDHRITVDEAATIIDQLLWALRSHGILEVVREPEHDEQVPGYQLIADSMRWRIGDGTKGYYDPISRPTESSEGSRTNPFFLEYYANVATDTHGIHAKEHTAQVAYSEREKREEDFRNGDLPILFCSPTMELGIDIAQLNTVNMRNVPPTPANYAQRSGRAGRSGQPALVFTYCSSGSPHDQYFFHRPANMVSGVVLPPQIDLANEDLIWAHIHSVWLAKANLYLGSSLKEILEVEGDNPSLELKRQVRDIINTEVPRKQAHATSASILSTIGAELALSDWYSDTWLDETLIHIPLSFEQACERWRGLYRAALLQAQSQDRIIRDASRSPADKNLAQRLRRDAEAQLRLLTEDKNLIQSDFYSYRYFASEGFLPGYNFPRLPLSAYIPGRHIRGSRDEFLSRPRFLAISEFGPRSIVYHEGSHYVINQVILPVRETEDLQTGSAKICQHCGYLHICPGDGGPDLCDMCNRELGAPLVRLFRLQNVVTKRRDRINCDEEERLRLGYEIKTVVRFAERGGQPSYHTVELKHTGESFGRILFGSAATLWRINLGHSRRRERNQLGFLLDVERGYWARSGDESPDESDPMSSRTERVVPYVEDRKNCLIIELGQSLGNSEMASIQAALKSAIQIVYELEDNELAAEPLPDRDNRRSILIYEATEGGAGVLRRLADDNKAISMIAGEALRLCHFDPADGSDLKRAESGSENCDAACYSCLMSYTNQPDHSLLDRYTIRETLMKLKDCDVEVSPATSPRSTHFEKLKRLCTTNLERDWLDFIEDSNFRLPSHAQIFMDDFNTRPDFQYREHHAIIYVDGPIHDYSDRTKRDVEQTESLENAGWTVIRFGHGDDWGDIIKRYPNIFGDGS